MSGFVLNNATKKNETEFLLATRITRAAAMVLAETRFPRLDTRHQARKSVAGSNSNDKFINKTCRATQNEVIRFSSIDLSTIKQRFAHFVLELTGAEEIAFNVCWNDESHTIVSIKQRGDDERLNELPQIEEIEALELLMNSDIVLDFSLVVLDVKSGVKSCSMPETVC